MDRVAALMASMQKTASKTEAAKERSDTKRRTNRPAGHLHAEWVKLMRGAYGDDLDVPPWAGREKGIAKALVKNVGGIDKATELISHFISTWEARQTTSQRMRGELPSIHLCWAMRQKLLAELSGHAKVPMSKGERLAEGEFSEEAEALSPKVGWGEALD